MWRYAARGTLFVSLFLLFCLSLAQHSAWAASSSERPGWILSFDDEFSGHHLDARRWTANRGDMSGDRERPQQYFLPDEVSVSGGCLHLRSEQRNYDGFDYTSGEIRSLNKFAQKYGRFEVRCRFPKTNGVWSAVYLLPAADEWPPEIDIAEFVGRTPDTIYLTNHWGAPEAQQQTCNLKVDPLADWSQWHIYAIEWEPGVLRWYIDGVLAGLTQSGVSDVPMYLRLNTAVGGLFAGPPAANGWPQDFQVDYVRVYRRPDLPSPVLGITAVKRPPEIASPDGLLAPLGEVPDEHVRIGPGWWALVLTLPLWLITCLVIWRRAARQSASRKLFAVAVCVSALDYLFWRATVIDWDNGWVAVPLFAAELFGILQVLGFHYTLWPRDQPELYYTEDPTRLPIFLFIPTVNEGAEIVRETVRGAIAARTRYQAEYPHSNVTIVICNDGCVANFADWPEIERLAEQMGVVCITRQIGGGAKAGNIEHARREIGAVGDVIIGVFDADMVPEPEFLMETMPSFADRSVGWVQTGQYYRNLDNPVARWANDQQSLFFRLLCPGKATLNANFICGTNFLMWASALDEIGGLPQDMLTEDFAASLLLHARWRSVYLTEVLATGLGPVDLPSYFSQQQRWAMGTFGVLRRHWRLICLPQPLGEGLTLPQRIEYALSGTHYLCGLCQMIFLLVPLIYLLTGLSPLSPVTLPVFLVHFAPYFLLSQIAFWSAAGYRSHLRGTIIGFGSAPALLASLSALFVEKRRRFVITAKTRGSVSSWRSLRPHGIALCVCLLGLLVAERSAALYPFILLSAFWLAYMLTLICAMLWLGYADWRAEKKATNCDLHLPERSSLIIPEWPPNP